MPVIDERTIAFPNYNGNGTRVEFDDPLLTEFH